MQSLFSEENSAKIKGTRQEDGTTLLEASRIGPSQEAIDAFVLTIRFFIQDNEECSLRNLSKYYIGSSLDVKLKDEFVNIREQINQFLDLKTFITEQQVIRKANSLQDVTTKEVKLSHRDIFDTFIYGGLSHAKRLKRQRYESWMAFPPSQAIFIKTFIDILGNFYQGLNVVFEVNERALSSLKHSDQEK